MSDPTGTSLSEQFVDYAAAASILDTAELACLVRRLVNIDPAGLSRRALMEALQKIPVPEDFSRTVGEVQEAAKVEQIRAAAAAVEGTPPEHAVDDDLVFSSQPGKWRPFMAEGPNRSEASNRLKWAKLLYEEQKAIRGRLLGANLPGVYLCNWDDDSSTWVASDGSDDQNATLGYLTENARHSLASIGRMFELDAGMLMSVNMVAYPALTSASQVFRKNTFVLLETEIPSDMIDALNDVYGLTNDDETDGTDDNMRLVTPNKRRKIAEDSPVKLAVDTAAMRKRFGKRTRKVLDLDNDSVEEQNVALKAALARALDGKVPDASTLARLGVKSGPAPSSSSAVAKSATAQGRRMEAATAGTQERILAAAAAEEGEADVNPLSFHRVENMSDRTRLRLLEGSRSLPVFSSPEEFATATARLVVENPTLSAAEKDAQLQKVFEREAVMRTYIRTGNLSRAEEKQVMESMSLDLVASQSKDLALSVFEKRGKTIVDQKLKEAQKALRKEDKTTETAAAVLAALEARGGGGRGGGGGQRGWEDRRGNRGGDGGGRGRGGGKGGKGRGRGECFVCGSVEHRAADCPRAFRREDGHAG